MKQTGITRFECCGFRLPAKFKFCPYCGALKPKPRTYSERELVLLELHKIISAHERYFSRIDESSFNVSKSAKAKAKRVKMELFKRCALLIESGVKK